MKNHSINNLYPKISAYWGPWYRVVLTAVFLIFMIALAQGCTSGHSAPTATLNSTPELRGIKQWPSELVYNQGELGSNPANQLAFIVRYFSTINSDGVIDYSKHMDASRLYIYWNARYLDSQIDPSGGGSVDIDTGSSVTSSVLSLKYFGACPENTSVEVIKINGVDLSGSYVYKGWPYIDDDIQFKKEPDPMSYYFSETKNIQTINLESGSFYGKTLTVNPYGNIRDAFDFIEIANQFINTDPHYQNTSAEKLQVLNLIKNALYKNHPIFIGLKFDDEFNSYRVRTTGVVSMPNIQNFQAVGGQSFVIVGYDYYIAGSSSKYFKCMNSWGPEWGDKGFVYFPEEYITNVNIFSTGAYETWFNSPLQ